MLRYICLILTSFSILGGRELSICTIFQDDAPYLKEWIEFHKMQGVEHFYLYNNNSQDDYQTVLDPYIAKGDVTLIQWPYTYTNNDDETWRAIQFGSYMHCIRNFGSETKWLAVIDSDEFLFCPTGKLLPEYLQSFAEFAGLCVNWIRFGTSGVEEIPDGKLMIEMLTECSKRDDSDNRIVKSIIQPSCIENCANAHRFLYKPGFYAVDAEKEKISSTFSRKILLDEIRINHYWTRTEKYFRERKIQSRYLRRNCFNEKKLRAQAKRCSRSTDTAILQYVDRLRKLIYL